MKVKELRSVIDDCWFVISVAGEEIEDDVELFNQYERYNAGLSTTIPSIIGNLEVDMACIDTPTEEGDSVLAVYVKDEEEDE